MWEKVDSRNSKTKSAVCREARATSERRKEKTKALAPDSDLLHLTAPQRFLGKPQDRFAGARESVMVPHGTFPQGVKIK